MEKTVSYKSPEFCMPRVINFLCAEINSILFKNRTKHIEILFIDKVFGTHTFYKGGGVGGGGGD